MKTSIHLRFAFYVFLVTAGFIGLALTWFSPGPEPWTIMSGCFLYAAVKSLGKEHGFFSESGREVSDRALIFGILGILVALWGGTFLIVHYHLISPDYHPIYLIWTVLGLIWLVWLHRGFRWWRTQKAMVIA